MQLFALDSRGQVLNVHLARKGTDYSCAECGGVVRRRGGMWRQDHYYHLDSVRPCRQSKKSLEHLQLQRFFWEKLPRGECFLEQRFETINRIADVVWLPEKLIFEVQCSPITPQEVWQRNYDYAQEGYLVIWVLHDKRYNQSRLSAMELILQKAPHYFSNMNAEGIGVIYDQFCLIGKGKRQSKLTALPIDVALPQRYNKNPNDLPLGVVRNRMANGDLYFNGDLTDIALRHASDAINDYSDYVVQALALEQRLLLKRIQGDTSHESWAKRLWKTLWVRPWRLLFQMLLEKACR